MKVRGFLAVGIGVILGISLSLGSVVFADKKPADQTTLPWDQARLLAEVLERVKRDYVEGVDDQRLIEAAIRGMVSDLDPHSAFLDEDEYDDIRISTSGKYSGVGIEVSVNDGRVVVVTPVDGSPARLAGILSGDIVISVDGMPVDSGNLNDTVFRLRGPPGTIVTVGILRQSNSDPLSFDLRRSTIQVSSVRHEILEPGYGYIRLTHFSETTASDTEKAWRDLLSSSPDELQGLVLDLRNNPGGVLEAAVEVADLFLESGTVVTADGRALDASFRLDATSGDILDGRPLTVLVNGGSASASEIVAGALQDHGRARLVGTRTFGKGSVQTVMPLSYGRAIKLTTSRYYTPSGRSIHESGIEPDVRTEQIAVLPNESIPQDSQLDAALGLLKNQRIKHSRAD
ncbi:MAG: S41 family peptidase [Gammaproteobacteria bacterium]